MRAIVQDQYGSVAERVLRLRQHAERPSIAGDEVLVRVRAASVDRGTWHIIAGLPYPIRLAGFGLRAPKPLNPGRSFAGTIESVGTDVAQFARGDDVFGTCEGSLAEYACAGPSRLAPEPANLTFEQAAAIPVSGLTALQAVRDQGRIEAGRRVLVVGASGGVGTFAVQIAARTSPPRCCISTSRSSSPSPTVSCGPSTASRWPAGAFSRCTTRSSVSVTRRRRPQGARR